MDDVSKLDNASLLHTNQSNRSIFLAAKGGGMVFVGSLFNYGGQLVIGIILTRFLGAEQYGQYKIALTSGEIATGFALLGMDAALVRFVSLFASRRNPERLWGTLQLGIGLTAISSLMIGTGLFILATPLSLYLFHEPQLVNLLRLSGLIVPLYTLSLVFSAATKGFNKMQYHVGAKQIAQPLVRMMLLVPLVLLGLTAGKAMVAYIVGIFVTCVLLLYFLNNLFSLKRPLNAGQRNIKELMHFSLPVYFSRLITSFGPNLQTILLGSLNTMTTVGIFAAASQISKASSMFNASIGTASDPIISELHGREDIEGMSHLYKTTSKWMFMVNLPMFLVVLLLSKPILNVFGHEFVKGSNVLITLALTQLVIASAGVSDGILAMTGNTPAKLVNSTIQVITSIGLGYLFIPRWGAFGSALAVLASSTVLHLFLVIEIFFLFRMLPYSLSFYKPVVAGLVSLIFGWITRELIHGETHLILAAINALVILAIYGSMILLLGLSSGDRAVFAQLQKRIVGKFSKK